MHALSMGTIFVFYASLFINFCLLAYIITGYTDKEQSK